ncbi:hypothetical protein PAPHI01_2613 [Pancytospora philotis]|nr:hypothetical protein PAPHI01_2613 [Pancytospora philotis]
MYCVFLLAVIESAASATETSREQQTLETWMAAHKNLNRSAMACHQIIMEGAKDITEQVHHEIVDIVDPSAPSLREHVRELSDAFLNFTIVERLARARNESPDYKTFFSKHWDGLAVLRDNSAIVQSSAGSIIENAYDMCSAAVSYLEAVEKYERYIGLPAEAGLAKPNVPTKLASCVWDVRCEDVEMLRDYITKRVERLAERYPGIYPMGTGNCPKAFLQQHIHSLVKYSEMVNRSANLAYLTHTYGYALAQEVSIYAVVNAACRLSYAWNSQGRNTDECESLLAETSALFRSIADKHLERILANIDYYAELEKVVKRNRDLPACFPCPPLWTERRNWMPPADS